jgi:Helix-turn-helix domain
MPQPPAQPNQRLRHRADDQPPQASGATMRNTPPNSLQLSPLLTPKEAAVRLKVSLSWLAKARMRGDGPAYISVGRSIRYSEATLIQWTKSRQRLSTSEQY